MAIRVLRIIEYVYENEEVAAADMANWTHSLAFQTKKMRSATLPFESIDWVAVIQVEADGSAD